MKMATLAKQTIPDYQKEMLELISNLSGESISTVVRGILKDEYERHTERVVDSSPKDLLYPEA
jgi:hypothetical protein